jgi:hypothetical protein
VYSNIEFLEIGADMRESLAAPLDVAPPTGSGRRFPAHGSARREPRWAAAAGIAGPVLVVVYFATPLLVRLPSPGAAPARLIAFATGHAPLFYAAGWLQVTGALLSAAFFLVLLQRSGARHHLAGALTLTGTALLLAVVSVEAVLTEAVPMAAATGDRATVATAFALADDGVFARVIPLAPAPLMFAGIGLALCSTSLLPRVFARSALVIAALFLLSGVAAVLGTPGLVFATVMSVLQAVWIVGAAVALATRRPR